MYLSDFHGWNWWIPGFDYIRLNIEISSKTNQGQFYFKSSLRADSCRLRDTSCLQLIHKLGLRLSLELGSEELRLEPKQNLDSDSRKINHLLTNNLKSHDILFVENTILKMC